MRIFFTLIIFCMNSAFALVDYSSDVESSEMMSTPKIDLSNLRSSKSSMQISQRNQSNFSRLFYFSTGFNSIDGGEKKYNQYNLGITLMTPWKIYFDLDLNYGGIAEEGSTFNLGNTEFSMGATWLEIGNSYDLITIDLLGGMSLGVEKSQIGSQRSDSFVGLLSKKNFGHFDLSLGFEYWFMDDQIYQGETSIGSYNKYLFNAGWTVSNDIRFDLGVQFINLGEIDGVEDFSYTELSPQIGLTLGRGVNLNLGARFSSGKNVEYTTLDSLKVWNISSLYGNSYFSKLSFNF